MLPAIENREMFPVSSTIFLKHSCNIINTYDFVDTTSKLVIHNEYLYLLITWIYKEHVAKNGHLKELHTVSEALQIWGHLYDGIMQLLEI